jgi:PAS domain S-box-containing protein
LSGTNNDRGTGASTPGQPPRHPPRAGTHGVRPSTSAPRGSGPAPPMRWIDPAPQAIALTEGAEHRLRRVNPAFCRMMGVEEAEVLGRPYAQAFPEPAGGGPLLLLESVLRSGEGVQDREVVRPRSGAGPVVWSYTVWPLPQPSDAPGGLVVEVRDRTHEAEATRRLEEMADQIRQINQRLLGSALREQELAERAEAGARAKSDFLAMMSHELRTPLSGIVGYTEVLLGGMQGPTNAQQRDSLQRIGICSRHLLEMIDEVLSFAQVEAQQVPVRAERVDLCEIAREVAAILDPLASEKGLHLHVSTPAAPLSLLTDGHKVRQVLLNLLGNALKFTEAGEVRLEVHGDEEGVHLRIQDTGIGIPAHDLERVFEPFVQSEAVTTRRFGGTGLGLPISRSLATLLGGVLTAQSTLGEGSIFTMVLPRPDPADA